MKKIGVDGVREAEKYYDNTEGLEPNYVIGEFLKLGVVPGRALELGCGAGRDTVCLIKNGWYVLAIDKEDVEERIRGRLEEDECKRFRFSRQSFEDVKLEECDLVVANFSLPFCDKSRFVDLWRKVEESICCGGYFVGNFFGDTDEWAETKRKMTFLTCEEVRRLFADEFEVVKFDEIEKDAITGMGKMKHWHVINVIARRRGA